MHPHQQDEFRTDSPPSVRPENPHGCNAVAGITVIIFLALVFAGLWWLANI